MVQVLLETGSGSKPNQLDQGFAQNQEQKRQIQNLVHFHTYYILTTKDAHMIDSSAHALEEFFASIFKANLIT